MSREQIAALLRKYRAIEQLRRERARSGEMAARERLRALAAEFPGVLRELHRVPPAEVARRRRALERALRTERAQPWMAWLWRYHALLRGALLVKRRLARGRPPSPAQARSIARAATVEGGARVDAAFVRTVATLSDGRLDRLVAAIVGDELGVAPAVLLSMMRDLPVPSTVRASGPAGQRTRQ